MVLLNTHSLHHHIILNKNAEIFQNEQEVVRVEGESNTFFLV